MRTIDFTEKRKTATILVRVEPEQKEALHVRAKRIKVPVPAIIRGLIRDFLKEQSA